jgi:hypothetical protein
MVHSEELIGITEYLRLKMRCRINRRRYNRVRLYAQEINCTTVTELRNVGKFLCKKGCQWENQTKKTTQRGEEENEELIKMGTDSLHIT